MDMKKVGFARTAIGLTVLAFCVYLLLSDKASAAVVMDNVLQHLQ